MKISKYSDEKSILSELGSRIQQYRISLNITQSELAQRCGLSLKTIARTEMGYDTKLSNLIKILNEIGLSENLDVLIPEPQPDYKAMFEEKAVRKRARPDKKKTDAWVWGEDKEDE
ncbi:MAG: helix-turn-helix transcriptional regulator [Clostridia bacterium]|nr:helix-turn-helix transcriptional regulator [Clostridia bacterium]MBQ7100848.1 helix-turn-helix transcriptional regulator [Clostridia bacterium]